MGTVQAQDQIDQIVAKLYLLMAACSNHEEKCPASLGAYYLIRDCLDTLAEVRNSLDDSE